MGNIFDVIRTVGDPILGKKTITVPEVNDAVRQSLDDMLQIMYQQEGCGLAANQIGINQRLMVIDIEDGPNESSNPRYYVNPQITWVSSTKDWFDEGCLSIPGVQMPIERPTEVKLSYLDREGIEHIDHITGFLARAVQHEVDHLNGILAIDHLSAADREAAIAQVAELKKHYMLQKRASPDLAPSL